MNKISEVVKMTKPPFPEMMTFKEFLEEMFNLDWMNDDEKETIFNAGEMYANACIKQAKNCSPTSQNKR